MIDGGKEPAPVVVGGERLSAEGWTPAVRQTALGPIRHSLRRGDASFAHPAELDFSRLLTFYRVRWSYEPTTFALAWAGDGRPAQMFTPDFYLPDQRLYIELTTMRQRLVTRKNRKLRRLRELYPNVQIKLLYRRDYHRLLDAYQGVSRPAEPCHPGRIVFDERTIANRVTELAAELETAWQEAEQPSTPLLLCVGRGSSVFATALTTALRDRGVAFETDRLDLTRYRLLGSLSPGRRVRVRRAPEALMVGRRVVIVEDVVSTGLSVAYLTRWLGRQRATQVDVCTLLDRRVARLVDIPVRYAGFEAPDEVLVGFGLHLRRQFRDLPYIAGIDAV
jgi:hypoxanthine phosphoribosyltransferase